MPKRHPAACFLYLFVVALLLAPRAAAAAAPPQDILIVHSYHQGFRWTDTVMSGMLDVLQREVPGAEIHVEYLDAKRLSLESFSAGIAEVLNRKASRYRPEAILVSDDAAFELMLSMRDKLFPGVPLIFCGVNNLKEERLAGKKGVTGVVEDFDIKGTIEVILALHRQTSHLAVISDSTETGAANRERFRKVAPDFADRLEFLELFDLSTEELLVKLAKLPPDAIILNLSFFRDRLGKSYSTRDGNHLIATHAGRPIYSCWDFFLAGDVVGGYMVSGRQQGQAAASMAAAILKGTQADDIPILRTSPNAHMFDAEVMGRFGIKESALPKGSIVLNRKMSVWEQYGGWLLGIVVIGALQSLLILALLTRGKRLRAANAALHESEEAFHKLFEDSSNPIMLMDRNRFVACNQATLHFLGMGDKTAFLNSTPEDISPRFQPDGTLSSESAQKYFAQAHREGYCRFEWQHLRVDQVPFLLEVTLMPMTIRGEKLLHVTWLDITKRKRAEEALLASERRFSALIRHSSDSITILDKDGIQVFVSEAVEGILGYKPWDLMGIPVIKEMIHPDDQDTVTAAFAAIINAGQGGAEYRHKHKNGSWVYLEAWGTNQLENPDIRGVVVNARNITDRKNVEAALRESREKYRVMFESLPLGLAVTDTAGLYVEINPAFEVLFGSPREKLLGVPPAERNFTVHHLGGTPFQRDELITLRAIAEQRLVQGDHLIRRADGTHRYFSSMAVPMPMTEYGAMLAVLDITERKQAEMALEKSVRQFHSLYDNMAEGVALHSLVHDDAGKLVNYTVETVNKSYESILGFSAQNVQGRLSTEVYGTDAPPFLEEFSAVATTGKPSHVELSFSPVGKHFAVSIAPWGDGGFSTIFSDITEHKQMEEQLLFRALHDPLTGLANRTLCLDRIAQANERADRDKDKSFAVVFIDLDRFKIVNDSLGHEAGDSLLRGVAQRLLECARRVDTVSRYGGDEFALVLEETSERDTVRVIKRIRESLKVPMRIGAHEVRVEASYGIAYGPCKDCRAEDLLRNANIALHHAKHSGRNKIVAYRSDMHKSATLTMQLQSDMRRGLDANEFFMMYQPIFNLNTNGLIGFEALIRWRHPTRGIVSPAEFIPLAEETGFIFELGAFALSQSCSDMAELLRNLASEDHLTISVNLSPKQFARQGLVDQIEHALISSGIRPSCVVLEITESSIMNYPEASVHTMARLKQKGVALAIDDFGTGYSSMSALQTMPLDRLKIDMSFVRRMTSSREDREIVRAIITLSHSLGLKTVAEGIETEEQRLALRHMGCDLGQGYLCSRPMFLADVPEAIRLNICTSTE